MPRLLDCLGERGIHASFYVAMGPDNSGRAIRRLFTRKGFARKMLRSKAVSLYGWRTVLYGTLLPAPEIARSHPGVLRRVSAAGHELGIHGNDHVYWHDRVLALSAVEVAREVGRALSAFRELLGGDPPSFAAPGWQCGEHTIAVLDQGPFRYHSSTRGRAPYRPRAGRAEGRLAEIPTTLPTMDELLGLGRRPEELVTTVLGFLDENRLNVLTVHAEVEGGPYLGEFSALLDQLRSRVRFRRLIDVAMELDPLVLPICEVIQDVRPGRAGTVSCQAS